MTNENVVQQGTFKEKQMWIQWGEYKKHTHYSLQTITGSCNTLCNHLDLGMDGIYGSVKLLLSPSRYTVTECGYTPTQH